MRIDVTPRGSGQPAEIAIDGIAAEGRNVRFTTSVHLPHGLVFIDGARAYGVEVWVSGDLEAVVPKQSASVESVYDAYEADYDRDCEPVPKFAMGIDRRDDLVAVQAEMSASAGRAAHVAWTGLSRTFGVYLRNQDDLATLLEEIETQPVVGFEMVQNVRSPEVREEVLARLDQYLHNFVSAAVSLVDHTRRIADDYEGTHFRAEYEVRKEDLRVEPVVGFVRDFRNLTLHQEIPFVGARVSFGAQGSNVRTSMLISVEALRQWSGWKAPAKEFLAAAGEEVRLSDVVIEHKEKVEALYEWFFRQFQVLHQADTFWLNELIGEYNWVLTGGREGRPRSSVLVPPESDARP